MNDFCSDGVDLFVEGLVRRGRRPVSIDKAGDRLSVIQLFFATFLSKNYELNLYYIYLNFHFHEKTYQTKITEKKTVKKYNQTETYLRYLEIGNTSNVTIWQGIELD